jgi:NinB protein
VSAKYIITGPAAREAVKRKADEVEEGSAVVFRDSDRTLEQNAIFHALCTAAAKECYFMCKRRSAMEWKVLFVSGHAKATGAPYEIVDGIEGEWLNIRESTAAMGKRRMSSLIEYVKAYLAQQGVQV